jgi:hypothetical protein
MKYVDESGIGAHERRTMKIVPQLDTYPRLVTFGQTTVGKAVLVGAFAIGLFADRVDAWIGLTVAIALITCFPSRRRLLLSMATLYWLAFHAQWLNWEFLREIATAEGQRTDWTLTALVYGTIAAVLCMFALFFHIARTRRTLLVAKRPVLFLVTSTLLLLAAADLLPFKGVTRLLVWALLAVTIPYLWYFAYALRDASAKGSDGVLLQFGTLRPFWGPVNVPYAKSSSNLYRVEVKNAHDLSVVQLKAIKLLIWVFILRFVLLALNVIVYADSARSTRLMSLTHWAGPQLVIPELEVALQMTGLPVYVAWASVLAHFAEVILSLTVGGNIIVACCRMAGFNILRNTYKPLQARTLSEFWNRYYYYFKELLVEFFFFPMFTRYFKGHRRVRMFAATMAAATLGNMIFHFLTGFRYVAELGLWKALAGFQTYFFYATVLGLGIGISQLRGHGKARLSDDSPWWRKTLATTGVLVFFCLLEVFDQEARSIGLGQCLHFFLRLFFIPA